MADTVLNLGGIAFADFEIPEEINAGVAQGLAVHQYPGGARTIDAMGPDDKPLKWSGYFEAPNAVERCQQLQIMARQGAAVVASWSAYSYLVVIKDFDWDFRRFYHIPYTLELEVAQDQTNPLVTAGADPENQMQSDASDAGADGSGLSLLLGAP